MCGRKSSYMHMHNSSLLGNEKLRGQVVRNVGGAKTNTKNVLNRTVHFGYCYIQSSDYGATIDIMLPKVVKQNGVHELFMNKYVVIGQWY